MKASDITIPDDLTKLSFENTMKGHSLVKYLTSAEWAILPDKLEQIESVVSQFISGTNLDISSDASNDVVTRGEVAIIPIEGTIVKKAYGLDAMSGVRTTLDVQKDIQDALENSAISAIVLRIDSPGGTVDGTKELADFISLAKQDKPIVAYADGTMASAAYWIGSAASKVVAFDTAKVGSIGVVVSHVDISEAEKKAGIKTSYIYQGQYKVVGNQTTPLDSDSKAHIQSHVDTYYSMFVDAVASQRGINREEVISNVALGAVFIGKTALDLNLVDSIGNLNDAINLALNLGEEKMTEKNKTDEMQSQLAKLTDQMATMETQLKEAQATNETLQEELADKQQAIELSQKAEAERVHLEKVTEQCKGLGLTDETISNFAKLDEDALGVVLGEIKSRQDKIDTALAEFTTPTEGATSETDDSAEDVKSIDDAVELIMTRDKCDIDEASTKAQSEYSDLFKLS